MSKAKFFVIPAATQGMDGFTSLRKAVRHILEAEEFAANSDDPYDPPAREILDGNGDLVEVDWEADEYKTREQLTKERDSAKVDTVRQRDIRLRAEKALIEHQKALIDAGLIPIDLLNDLIMDIQVKSDPAYADFNFTNYQITQMPMRVTARVDFMFAAPDTAAHYALNKLLHHKR